MSKKFQKIVSVTTSVATILWVSGIGMLAPLAVSATTINEGDTIKTASNPDVYIAKYVGSKMFKRLILSPSVFNSYKHLSWGAIKTVTQAEMDQFTESMLVRAVNDPKVYKLTPTPSSDDGQKQWVNMTAEQFTALGYDWDSIYQINAVDRDSYAASADITSGTPPVTPGTTLQVALASNTAVSGTLVATQAGANLASFTFTAPSNGAVKVTSLKLKRLGVSGDTTLSAVYVYEGTKRLTDSASVSSGIITWNNSAGILTVPAGTTKTIIVKSDILTGTAGQTVGVGINALTDITTDGAIVSGYFPINGNLMTIATAGSLAGVSFATATTPATDGTPAPQNEFVLWQSTVTVTTRAVDMSYITFRQIGSVLNADLANFKLFIDGFQIGSTVAAMDSDGYVTFDLTAAPKKIEAGARVFKVLVDLVGGSTRTTSLSLRYVADAMFADTQYGVNITIQANSTTFSARTSHIQTIAAGTLTVTKVADSPSGNIVNGAANAVFAKFELKAAGEPIKIESLDVAIHTSTGASATTFRNGALYVDGVQVGSTASIAADTDSTLAYTRFSLGSSLIVTPGTTRTLEVRADVFDDDGTNDVVAGWTVRADLLLGANNAQLMTSLGFINAPTALTSGNTMTVKEGTLALVRYTGYTNQTATAPKTAFKVGEWRLTAATTEIVNLSALAPVWYASNNAAGTGDFDAPTKLSDCYFTYGDKTSTVKSTVASSTDSYSINYALASGATIPIAFYCTVASGTLGVASSTLAITGTTAQSAAAANASAVAGQDITWGAGSLTTAATEIPLDQLAYAGQTVEAANYEITAANDTFLVNQVCVKFRNAANAAIVKAVHLFDGTTELTNPTTGTVVDGSGYATTTGLMWTIPANTTKTLTAKLELNQVGTNNVAAALNASTTLNTLLVYDSNGSPSYSSTAREGNAVLVYKSFPAVALSGGASYTVANDSSYTVYKFTVTPSAGGSVSLKQFQFELAWTDLGPTVDTLELDTIKFFEGSVDMTDYVTITDGGVNGSAKGGTGVTEADTTGGLVIAFTTEKTIAAATEFTIKATPRLFDKGTTSTDQVVITLNSDTTNNESGRLVNCPACATMATVWGLDDSNTGDATVTSTAKFIWSDRDVIPHTSTSGSSSADWFNGYLVKSLPLDGVVIKP